MSQPTLDLRVHFEPIVRVADGHHVASELLLRPVGGGQIHERAAQAAVEMSWITRFALRTVGAALEGSAIPIHVNITPADLARESFIEEVRQFVRTSDLRSLVLEVTEHTPLTHGRQIERNLVGLRRLGVRFAIDDLNDGWAGLGSLRIVEPEIVKIRLHHLRGTTGRSEAQRLRERERDQRSIVIVEQIEDGDDLALLQRLGLSHAQGWHWSAGIDPQRS